METTITNAENWSSENYFVSKSEFEHLKDPWILYQHDPETHAVIDAVDTFATAQLAAQYGITLESNRRTIKLAAYAPKVLLENYNYYVQRQSTEGENYYLPDFFEWLDLELANDPNLYRWITNDTDIADFGSNLTEEQKQQIIELIKKY